MAEASAEYFHEPFTLQTLIGDVQGLLIDKHLGIPSKILLGLTSKHFLAKISADFRPLRQNEARDLFAKLVGQEGSFALFEFCWSSNWMIPCDEGDMELGVNLFKTALKCGNFDFLSHFLIVPPGLAGSTMWTFT
jgi:hypothetical protein